MIVFDKAGTEFSVYKSKGQLILFALVSSISMFCSPPSQYTLIYWYTVIILIYVGFSFYD